MMRWIAAEAKTDLSNSTWSVVRPLGKSADDPVLCIHQERVVSITVNEFERTQQLHIITTFYSSKWT